MTGEVPRGRFVWYDLMTTDPNSAIDFYSKVIGWGTQQWQGGDNPYTMWANSGVPMGGVMQLPEEATAQGAPPHWLAYIATPDTKATANRAVELGGKLLVPPKEIPTVGTFSVIRDPQGAVFAVYTPSGDSPGHEGPAHVGEFSWHELATNDHDAAFSFYQELFGWDKTDAMDMGEMGTYQMYGRSGGTLGGMFNKGTKMPGPPAWILYTRVDDVHQTAEKVKENGGQVVNEPMQVPDGDWIAHCIDPNGAFFAIHSKKKETGSE